MFNIVLVNPQIPYNTGAIGRLIVNTDSKLHIIKPIGFDLSDKSVKRAGLDYWHKLNLTLWESFEEFESKNIEHKNRFFFATTKTDNLYFDFDFKENDFLIFGSETSGIPENILEKYSQQNMTIPMGKEGRSLNLAISTGIILYKAIEQNYKLKQ
jgi:tRNA (cytidine/uridine-2'-O-)-methyltransferase